MTINQNEIDVCTETCHHDDVICHAQRNMPDGEVLENLAELFKTLGDPTRARILWALSLNTMCVCDLSEALNMTQSAISHQLRLLKNAKLVKGKREGRSVFYSLADAHVALLFAQGLEHVQEKEE